MDSPETVPALVVIAGPQAAGKSTVATALATELRAEGERVALVELDGIAAMALPTLPGWGEAHEIFASVVVQWLGTRLTCVVAEGSGLAREVADLRARVPQDCPAITVVLSPPFEVALARAQADPTRGLSRDREFLGAVYAGWPDEVSRMDPDAAIDTGGASVAECVARIRSALGSARDNRRRWAPWGSNPRPSD